MKKTKRRILSIVLTLVMIAGVIPFGAITSFATDSGTFADLQQLIYDAADGGTIKLTKDYVWGKDDDDPLMIQNRDSTGKTLTIDMNGHKISGDSDWSCIAVDRWIEEGTTSKLTLIDNSASGGGTICSGGSGVFIDERGTLIAKNIKFTGNETGVYNSEGCMIIENCEFTGNEYGISNYWTMAVTDTTVTGNEYGIANNGDDLYIGGSTKVTDNEGANIYLEKDTYKYTGESAWADEFYDLAPFTLGDGTTQIEALGNYVVKAPSNDFKAGITTWECESSTPMYYDEFNMEWYPDWGKTESVKDEACAGAFTTNGTADDVKYFFADDPTKYVKFDTDKLVLDTIPSGSYKITVNSGDHGVVYADKQFATSGEEVTLNVVPDNGYQLKKLTVLSAISMAPPITPVQDASDKTKYTFKMPGYPVRGTAEFEEAPTVTKPEGAEWIVNEGDNHVWYKLEQITDTPTYKLTIGGTGAMPDFNSVDTAPWKEYEDMIKTVVIGSGVTAIGSDAFSGFEALTSVTIPSSVTTINKNAFYMCGKLTNVILSNGVMSIGNYAFAQCNELTSVTIPSSVMSIGEFAFQHCQKLTAVIKATTPPTLVDSNALEDAIAIYIPAGTLNTYKIATNWEYLGPEYGNKLKEAYVVDVVAATHGTVTVDRDFVAKDETVNVTVTPDEGYQLKSLKYNDGTDHDITEAKSFTMPLKNVTVTAEFEEVPAHTHKASENYMANASAHWFACSGDDCSLKGKTDAETLANYEAAFADKDTGEALKTTLGYTAHSGMGDFKCDVCNYEDVAGAIESIKTELGVAKSRALCDEARAAFDTAIENVEKATTLEGVNNARKTGIDNAVKADMLFSQSVIEAKTRLGKLKGEVKSDKAKAEIDTAIENVEKATNPENVDKALREGTNSANEADKKFEKAVKDAKDALDAQNKNDPLLDDSSVTTGKENIDKATSLIAVENAKNTAVENIKKAQAEELAKAKETAKNALDDENAKDELIDNSSVTTGKQNVDNALTKAAVSSAKDTAIGNIQSAQAEELKKSKEAAKAALDEENAKDPLEDETALINAKNDIDKASTKAGVEKAKTDGISNVISARETDTICHKCGYHHSDSCFGIAFCWIVRAVRCIINLVNIIADIIS